jgi:acyl-CoA synthetase (AMP-forming)/AMP-acid ligase II
VQGQRPQTPGTLSQTAPPDNARPVTGGLSLPSSPLDTLVKAGVLNGSVHARWSDTLGPCVGTISDASTELASLALLNAIPSLPGASDLAGRFDAPSLDANADQAVGELVNTQGAGYFNGYYNDDAANDERMRHGMYWSGDLAYRDADGWIYLAGRTADWMRVDGENLAAAPIERVLLRLPAVSQVAVYAVPDDNVGDQVMAAIVLHDDTSLTPAELTAFLASQADLPTKGWPRYVRIAPSLPSTATNVPP